VCTSIVEAMERRAGEPKAARVQLVLETVGCPDQVEYGRKEVQMCLGIPGQLRPEFADLDAELHYKLPRIRVADPKACQCGEVLKGVIKPWECKVFGTACTPATPIGTCMVSSEGACAAYYNFGRMHREAAVTLGRSNPLPARPGPA
jgi:hydrogenase expression/formation protein HypD